MVDFEEMKERYPRSMIIVQGFWILLFATILSYILFAPFRMFNVDTQVLVDIFTFPADIIPQPCNLIGAPFIIIGMFLIIWANYTLLYIGRLSLRNREPMQKPEALVVVGPYRFSRNPLYLGGILALLGLEIVWSSLVTEVCIVLVYVVLRYVFIERVEVILEEAFGNEYLKFKKRVRRWI